MLGHIIQGTQKLEPKEMFPSMEMTTFSVTKISLARCFASIYFSLKSGTTFQPLFGRVTHDSCVTDPNGD